jgi:hypothetical protein
MAGGASFTLATLDLRPSVGDDTGSLRRRLNAGWLMEQKQAEKPAGKAVQQAYRRAQGAPA